MAQAYWTPPGSGEGSSGENGATFTPNVNETTGILSWTNDKGLDNPPAVNVKGPQGDKGDPGDPGADGADGVDGAPGADGADGVDGFSPVITENAGNTPVDYRLDITTAAGTITTPNLQAVSFVENAQVYSTEETIIGTWIDGKPLYGKVIITQMPAVTTNGTPVENRISMADENIDFSVSGNGSISDGSTITFINSHNLYESASFIFYERGSASLVIRSNSTAWNNRMMYIGIEYTKTTDEATIAIATAAELTDAYEEGVQAA